MEEKFSIIRRSDGRIEVSCEHGVGHPIFAPKRMGGAGGVHGCDGCCHHDDFKAFVKTIDLKKLGINIVLSD